MISGVLLIYRWIGQGQGQGQGQGIHYLAVDLGQWVNVPSRVNLYPVLPERLKTREYSFMAHNDKLTRGTFIRPSAR